MFGKSLKTFEKLKRLGNKPEHVGQKYENVETNMITLENLKMFGAIWKMLGTNLNVLEEI